MKEKALLLIGLHSKKWLCEKMGINHLTLEKRLKNDNWKTSEVIALESIYQDEIVKL